MDYTVKLAYQSNYWYNDGLAKAQVRDMSGAITSLKKSPGEPGRQKSFGTCLLRAWRCD